MEGQFINDILIGEPNLGARGGSLLMVRQQLNPIRRMKQDPDLNNKRPKKTATPMQWVGFNDNSINLYNM